MGFMGLEFTIGLAVATVVFGLICWLAFDVGKTAYQWLKDVTGLEFSNGPSHTHDLNLDNDKYPLRTIGRNHRHVGLPLCCQVNMNKYRFTCTRLKGSALWV